LFEKCRQGRATGFGDNMAFVGILSTMLVHDLFIRSSCITNSFADTRFARLAKAV